MKFGSEEHIAFLEDECYFISILLKTETYRPDHQFVTLKISFLNQYGHRFFKANQRTIQTRYLHKPKDPYSCIPFKYFLSLLSKAIIKHFGNYMLLEAMRIFFINKFCASAIVLLFPFYLCCSKLLFQINNSTDLATARC